MYECHHGNFNIYARKIWAWDDGDSIPENNEIEWPTCLYITDVYQLDNDHPATAFLRSCLCGKPEVTSLAAQLLHYGSSAIISSSRIAWMTFADPGGMPYHFFDRLMKDNSASNGIIGKAYDIARNDFMDVTGFWLPAYHYNLFGDPALRQFGELVGVEETANCQFSISNYQLSVYPNPFREKTEIKWTLGTGHSALGENPITNDQCPMTISIYDVSGRLVKSVPLTTNHLSLGTDLKTGVYFLKVDGVNVGKVVKVR